MIRIRVQETEEQFTIQVEGQLVGIFTKEVERCWHVMRSESKHKIVLDLNGVIQIGSTGRHLLRSMHGNGVTFTGARLSMQDVLDEIMHDAICMESARDPGRA